MRKKLTLATVAILLIAMNTSAQIDPPCMRGCVADVVDWVLAQDPIDPAELKIANTNLYFSLTLYGEPCGIDPTWTVEIQDLAMELCVALNFEDQDQMDLNVVAEIESDIANEIKFYGLYYEPPPACGWLPGEHCNH